MTGDRAIVVRVVAVMLPALLSCLPPGNVMAQPGQAPARTSSNQEPAVAPWFSQVLSRFAAIPERQESFQERKQIAALSRPLVSEGRLVYRRPSYLEKITTAPRPEVLLVDGDQLTLTGPDGVPHALSLSSHPEVGMLVDAVGGLLSGDLGRLEKAYQVQVSGDASSWQLGLLPTSPRVRTLLRQIVVRGQGTAIDSMMTILANGDSEVLTIVAQPQVPQPPSPSTAAPGLRPGQAP